MTSCKPDLLHQNLFNIICPCCGLNINTDFLIFRCKNTISIHLRRNAHYLWGITRDYNFLDKLTSISYLKFMKTLPVGEFKSHFSEVLENIKNGEEIAVSFGKKKKKIAVLVPYESYKKKNKKRTLGSLKKKGKLEMINFEMTDEEFLKS